MKNLSDWKTLYTPDMEELPYSVYLRSQNLSGKTVFDYHAHPWNQFTYATEGTLIVDVQSSRYIITPEQAIWIPADTLHSSGALMDTALRTLYIRTSTQLRMPGAITVYAITPLLRTLILELERMESDAEDTVYTEKVNDLIIEQLYRLKCMDFHLPWPQSPLLRKICEAVYEQPDDEKTAWEWGNELGASARTLTRHFEKETGMSLREWRRKVRLFRAMEWLEKGMPVTTIAMSLGYSSVSAFVYMFRTQTGLSPTEWRKK
ncbi:helix-turn-helix transcriptional regulator [Oxalobacter sp. OttesenSCG-928-P03]|nr:helix-turn-helix transcriptional regulator [Oxalobacter sp. OttesenSCG-928-P03]